VKASPDGLRRALVSIFYENFERQGDAARTAAAIDELRDANATLRAENAELRARLEAIERMMRGIAAQSAGGRP
jgi:hypothetical protein